MVETDMNIMWIYKCVFVWNCLCVHVFVVKTESYNVTVLIYVYVRACMLEKQKYQKVVCGSLYMWGNSDIPRSVANIPILLKQWMYLCWLYVLPCWLLSLSVQAEMSETVHVHETSPVGSQNIRERKLSKVHTI